MIEYMLVETATIFPMTCVCGSAKGPLVDTMIENPVGRVYLCKLCARRAARLYGFAPGKRLDELADAETTLQAKEDEIAKLVAAIEELRLQNGSERRTVKDLQARLSSVQDVQQTSRHLAAAIEQQAHELVEAVAPVLAAVEAVAS